VIPEDPKNNGYILKPIIARVLTEAGLANPRVEVLSRSKLNGIAHAKDAIRHDLASAYGWMNLWIFVPDADRTNADAMNALERELAQKSVSLICCAAQPEVEAWMLAGHRAKISVPWPQVAGHPKFKEEVFDPFMEQHGFPDLPGNGRGRLTLETLANYPALKQFCPEIATLENRVRQHFSTQHHE
jgi:hypothetical protein